jgi:hypothetical protein
MYEMTTKLLKTTRTTRRKLRAYEAVQLTRSLKITFLSTLSFACIKLKLPTYLPGGNKIYKNSNLLVFQASLFILAAHFIRGITVLSLLKGV